MLSGTGLRLSSNAGHFKNCMDRQDFNILSSIIGSSNITKWCNGDTLNRWSKFHYYPRADHSKQKCEPYDEPRRHLFRKEAIPIAMP